MSCAGPLGTIESRRPIGDRPICRHSTRPPIHLMISSKKVSMALALAGAAQCMPAFANNVVVNGGFEDAQTGWSIATIGSGFTGSYSVYIFEPSEQTLYVSAFGNPGGLGLPGDSTRAAWLGCGYSTGCAPGLNEAALSQTLNTVAGQSYSLSFLLGAAYGSSFSGSGTVDVFWNGVQVGGQSFAGTVDSPFGTSYQIGNLLAQGSDLLQFRTHSGALIGLDEVTVSAVPEPSTYATLAAGLALLGLRRARKTRG